MIIYHLIELTRANKSRFIDIDIQLSIPDVDKKKVAKVELCLN